MFFGGRNPKIVGIDIGSYAIKIAGLKAAAVGRMEFCDVIHLPEKPDMAFISEAISRILKKYGAASAEIRLNISDESIHIRRLELPSMPEHEMLEALKWQIKDRLAFDIDKALMDFKQLREIQKEDGSRAADILFAAVSRDAVEGKLSLFNKMGLKIVSVNVSPFALENYVKASDEMDPSHTALVIDLGHSKTDISFYKDKALQFIRTIPIAAGDITAAMQAPVAAGTEKTALSRGDAEAIKHQVGIPYEPMRLESGLTSVQILTMMRGTLERLSKELKRSVEYYISEVGGEGISQIYLTGGGALLKNIDKYLSEELNLPVRALELPKALGGAGSGIPRDTVPSISCAAGAALNTTKQVNLLPREHAMKKMEAAQMVSVRLVSIILGVVLVFSYLVVKLRVDDYARRVKNAFTHKSVLGRVRQVSLKIAEREKILEAAKRGGPDLEYIMKELSNLIPQGVVLNSMSIDPKAGTMDISGVVYDASGKTEDVLTRFMEALESSRCFREAQLGGVQDQSSETEKSSSFSISCQLR